jgi:hypothetical protein
VTIVQPPVHNTLKLLALLCALALPLGALAQEAAPALPDDPRAPRFHEVERGLFTGFEVGYLSLFKTPTADRAKFPFAGEDGGRSDGLLVGASIGYDVTDRIALSVFTLGSSSRASLSYGGFGLFAAGGDVRFGVLRLADRNDVTRAYVYLHGRAGYLLTYPEGLFGTRDVYVAGGPGLEYFTHLRHFSVGLAADLAYVVKAKAPGLAVFPTVRYTF